MQCVCLVIVLSKVYFEFLFCFVESGYSVEYLPLSNDVCAEYISDQTVAINLFCGVLLTSLNFLPFFPALYPSLPAFTV